MMLITTNKTTLVIQPLAGRGKATAIKSQKTLLLEFVLDF